MFPCNFLDKHKDFYGRSLSEREVEAPEEHKLNNRFSWEFFVASSGGLRDETVGFNDVTLMAELSSRRIFG